MQETINSANAAVSTLFLGHNGEWWDSWLIISVIFAAFAAVAIGVTTAGSIVSHKREARAADMALAKFQSKTAGEIADANARVAEATEKAAEAQLALEKFKAPRVISEAHKADLIKRLEPFSGTEFDAATNVHDNEQMRLLASLMDVLTRSGWKQIDWKYAGGGLTYTIGAAPHTSPNIGDVAGYDIEIQVRQESIGLLKPAAQALALELIGIGIPAHDVESNATTLNNANVQAIHLIVGQKL